jgi:phospholipase D1/2
MKKTSEEDSEDEEQFKEPQSSINPSSVIDTKRRYFIGKDYSNPYEKDFETLDKYSEGINLFFNYFFIVNINSNIDYIDRTTVPRMPWHDEALVVFGKVARDVARHFIQRWNIHKVRKSKFQFLILIFFLSVKNILIMILIHFYYRNLMMIKKI